MGGGIRTKYFIAVCSFANISIVSIASKSTNPSTNILKMQSQVIQMTRDNLHLLCYSLATLAIAMVLTMPVGNIGTGASYRGIQWLTHSDTQ